MNRRAFLSAVPAAILVSRRAAAGQSREMLEFFANLATALASGDSSSFLAAFDPAMPGFETLRADVIALVDADSVQSAIDVLRDEGDARRRSVEADWLLHLTSRADTGEVIRRRKTIHCRLEKHGKHWKIISFDAPDFFTTA